MDSIGRSNVPGRVMLELLASHGSTMGKEELQKIQLKVTQLLTEKEKAATIQSEYAIHGDQLYCPKEMVSPRGTVRSSKSANTADPWQVDGAASNSSVPWLPARKAPPPQRKAQDAAKPVGLEEAKQCHDPNELIRFPDG